MPVIKSLISYEYCNMRDKFFFDVAYLVVWENNVSLSQIKHRFNINFSRSARIVDQLSEAGILSAYTGSWKVLKEKKYIDKLKRAELKKAESSMLNPENCVLDAVSSMLDPES